MATWQMRKQTLRDLCEVTEARAGLEAPPGSLDARCHAQDRVLSYIYGMRAALTGPSWGFCVAPCTTPSAVPGKCTPRPPLPGRGIQTRTSSPAPSGCQDNRSTAWPTRCCQNTHTPLIESISTHGDRPRHPGLCCPHSVCVSGHSAGWSRRQAHWPLYQAVGATLISRILSGPIATIKPARAEVKWTTNSATEDGGIMKGRGWDRERQDGPQGGAQRRGSDGSTTSKASGSLGADLPPPGRWCSGSNS